MLSWLKGRKTYLIGMLMLLLEGAVASGHITRETADWIYKILGALGLLAARAAIGKVVQK